MLPIHEHDSRYVRFLVTSTGDTRFARYAVFYQFELFYELQTYIELGAKVVSVERIL